MKSKTVKAKGHRHVESGQKLWDAYCPEVPYSKRRQLYVRFDKDGECVEYAFSWDE